MQSRAATSARLALVAAAVAAALTASATARATPFVPKAQLVEHQGAPAILEHWTDPAIPQASVVQRFALIAAFEKSLQYVVPCPVSDAGSDAGSDAASDAGDAGDAAPPANPCKYGGEIEVQTGPGNAIIESDNTQESIWIWSTQKALAGDGSFSPQIANAFEFLNVFPGYLKWQETGDPGPDYYSVYNCGWGVRAVLAYEAAFGDTSHHGYGDMCAAHIATNAATVAGSGKVIDVATAAFGASGLWLWGTAQGDATLQQTAASIGGVAKAWLDANPGAVALETWAITGGAVYDGVLGSYMKAHPSELVPWVTTMAPMLGGWIDESMPAVPNDWTDWRNAHAAWNMLAQFDTGLVLGEDGTGPHNQIALGIYSKIVAQDVQGNGGVPGSQQRQSAMEDESWITAYMAYFGLRPFLADMALDAGAPEAGAADASSDAARDATTATGDAGAKEAGTDAAFVIATTPSGSSGGCSLAGAGAGRASSAAHVAYLALFVAALALGRRRRPAVSACTRPVSPRTAPPYTRSFPRDWPGPEVARAPDDALHRLLLALAGRDPPRGVHPPRRLRRERVRSRLCPRGRPPLRRAGRGGRGGRLHGRRGSARRAGRSRR